MKPQYLLFLVLCSVWSIIVYVLVTPKPVVPSARMTIRLNTTTPIVNSGELVIMDKTGREFTFDVEAGDTFVLRSN